MKKKIFTILGDYYHDHDLAYIALTEALKLLPQEVEVSDITIDKLSSILIKDTDLIILFKENRMNPNEKVIDHWMTPQIEKMITTYVSEGGNWMAWHAGLASYPDKGIYHEMLRGYFKQHPSKNQVVHYTARTNNLSICVPESFEMMDEHYFVECDNSNTNVFLFSESIDGSSEAGWAHEFGRGQVCCLTPTHRTEGFNNRGMIETLRECIKWCLK